MCMMILNSLSLPMCIKTNIKLLKIINYILFMAKNSTSSVSFHFPCSKSHFLIDDSGLMVSHAHLFYDLFLHNDVLRKNSLK